MGAGRGGVVLGVEIGALSETNAKTLQFCAFMR